MADYRKNKVLKGLNRSHFPSNASENVTDVTQFFTGKNYDRIRNLKLFLENGGDCAKNKDVEFLLENMEVDSSAHVDHFIEDKETGNIYRNDGKKWYKCEDGSEEFVEVDPNNDEFLKAKQKDILKAIVNGADGVGLTSGIIKAMNPFARLKELMDCLTTVGLE